MSTAVACRTDELVLSAWFTVSPFGVGKEVFADGIAHARSGISEVDKAVFPVPYDRAGMVPDFTAAKYLGRKGTRLMDRLTALAVTSVGGLVEQASAELSAAPERAGLVLGTGWASVQSIMDTTRDSLSGEKPYHVDPAKFPNTVMNKAAGQSAIWHTIKGPNTTISGDWLTGLLALSYAARLYRGGHTDRVLCGAVEEYSTQRAWLEWHAGAASGERAHALGEGGAFFLLESSDEARAAGRPALARVLGTRFRAFGAPDRASRALSDCVRSVLAETGTGADQVRLVSLSGVASTVSAAEEEAVNDALGESADRRRIRCGPLVGDTSAVATGFQLAAVLAELERSPFGTDDAALITAIGRDGTVGCALLGGAA